MEHTAEITAERFDRKDRAARTLLRRIARNRPGEDWVARIGSDSDVVRFERTVKAKRIGDPDSLISIDIAPRYVAAAFGAVWHGHGAALVAYAILDDAGIKINPGMNSSPRSKEYGITTRDVWASLPNGVTYSLGQNVYHDGRMVMCGPILD